MILRNSLDFKSTILSASFKVLITKLNYQIAVAFNPIIPNYPNFFIQRFPFGQSLVEIDSFDKWILYSLKPLNNLILGIIVKGLNSSNPISGKNLENVFMSFVDLRIIFKMLQPKSMKKRIFLNENCFSFIFGELLNNLLDNFVI